MSPRDRIRDGAPNLAAAAHDPSQSLPHPADEPKAYIQIMDSASGFADESSPSDGYPDLIITFDIVDGDRDDPGEDENADDDEAKYAEKRCRH